MQNRAYRFERNSDRDEYRQQSNFHHRTLETRNDCCHESDRKSNHKQFDFRNKRQISHNHHKFNSRSRNSHRCRQLFRNRGGW